MKRDIIRISTLSTVLGFERVLGALGKRAVGVPCDMVVYLVNINSEYYERNF
jgi:hypothetical protein